MNNNTLLDDDSLYYDSQTNQIVAILLPIVIGIVGLTYFCCKHKCKKKSNDPSNTPTSSTAPIVLQV